MPSFKSLWWTFCVNQLQWLNHCQSTFDFSWSSWLAFCSSFPGVQSEGKQCKRSYKSEWEHYTFLENCPPNPPYIRQTPFGPALSVRLKGMSSCSETGLRMTETVFTSLRGQTVGSEKINWIFKLYFTKCWQTNSTREKVLPEMFHLNGHIIRFHPQTQEAQDSILERYSRLYKEIPNFDDTRCLPVSPHERDSGFRNLGKFCLWNREYSSRNPESI